jgi:hypothetical protein
MRHRWCVVMVVLSGLCWAAQTPAQDSARPAPAGNGQATAQADGDANANQDSQGKETSEGKRRLDIMAKRVAKIRAWKKQGGGDRLPLDGHEQPIFRLMDPTRDYPDGTVWAWPAQGRPAALLTLSVFDNGSVNWLYEFVSFSAGPVGADFGGGVGWSSQRPGWEPLEFSDAPTPADSARGRLRQMRALAGRFEAVELLPPPERFQLRLLPQPMLRYSDPAAGQLDGAIFSLCHGTNPEVLLVIEAAQGAEGAARYQYALAPNTIAELEVKLDGKQVWTRPYIRFGDATAEGPYHIAVLPPSAEENLAP